MLDIVQEFLQVYYFEIFVVSALYFISREADKISKRTSDISDQLHSLSKQINGSESEY